MHFEPSHRISSMLSPGILERSTMLSIKHGSTNLGQGFPDSHPPKFLLDALAKAAYENEDQYTKVTGLPILIEKLAAHYSDSLGYEVKPENVVVSSGATTSINNVIAAYCNPGDEVITFDPFFSYYIGISTIYGAKTTSVILSVDPSGKFTFKWEEFAKAFTEKTRFLILNTPNNPSGKLFTEEEYKFIAEVVQKHPRVMVISDEVYEYIVFDGRKMVRFSHMPGMKERTFNVYSWGKILSCTGWRLGVTIGPAHLLKPAIAIQNWENFCSNRPIMKAWAAAIEEAHKPYEGHSNYFESLKPEYQRKKDFLVETLLKTKLDWQLVQPEGGYFVMVDITRVLPVVPLKYFYPSQETKKGNYGDSSKEEQENVEIPKDEAVQVWLTVEHGVTAVPLSSFFLEYNSKKAHQLENAHYLRFAICKSDATLAAAREKLWKIDLQKGSTA